MTALLSPSQIEDAFVGACRAELRAIKAGNVHIHAAGHDMDVEQFERAADAAAPHIANPALRVGARVRLAVEASFAAAGCNTNLGILLLCAPIAAAAEATMATTNISTRLSLMLTTLDTQDAEDVYRAISHANPGGLGEVATEDVSEPANVTLLEAMALAKDRDRIANAYFSNFTDVFDFALPELAAARRVERTEEDAIANLHLKLLATFPDSHIARKYGIERAEEIRAAAAALRPRLFPLTSRDARDRLLAFDASLKSERINPGTTADFVVATLFTDTIIRRGRQPVAVSPLVE